MKKGTRKTYPAYALPPVVDSLATSKNAAEVLMAATNNIIDLYNKVSSSVRDEEIQGMDIKTKISTLQKLSFIHSATKRVKQGNLNFISINTKGKSTEDLEEALLKMNEEEESSVDED